MRKLHRDNVAMILRTLSETMEIGGLIIVALDESSDEAETYTNLPCAVAVPALIKIAAGLEAEAALQRGRTAEITELRIRIGNGDETAPGAAMDALAERVRKGEL